jgi:hypothetical protein
MTLTSLTTPEDSNVRFKPSSAPSLTDEQLSAATEQLVNTAFVKKFPVVDRNYADPPVNLQQIGLFSFIPAKGAKPNDRGIYGFAKMRGNFATEMEANQRAELLIKDHDSTNTIFHTYVGRPFPITVNENYASETSEVDIRKDTVEAVSNTMKIKKDDDKRKAQEIQDREAELLADTSSTKEKELVEQDDYITLKVKKAQLTWTYIEHVKKLKEVKEIIIRTRAQLVDIDAANPSLNEKYYEKYKDARVKAGLKVDDKALSEGFTKYLVEDVLLPGIDDISDELIETVMKAPDLNPDVIY